MDSGVVLFLMRHSQSAFVKEMITMMSKLDWFIDDVYNVLKEHETLTYCVSSCIGVGLGLWLSWAVIIPFMMAR
jgi:hypothetical protein